MAQDGEVKVKISVTSAGDGAAKAERELGRVGSAAKRASAETKGALERMQGAAGKVQGAFGALRNAMAGFGVGALVGAMTAGVGRIAASFGAAKKEAEEFAEIQRRLAAEKAVAKLAADYAKLSDAVERAAAAQGHDLDMVDLRVRAERKLVRARLDAEKESRLAALDPKAADYAERRAAVEQWHAGQVAGLNAFDAEADLVYARQRMAAEADALDERAGAQDAASGVIRARIAQARREKSAADYEAVNLNERDKSGGFGDTVGKTLGQLFTGDWGRMGGVKTVEGDAVRKAAAERSAQLEKSIDALVEELRRSNEAAERTRRSAANVREKAEAMGTMVEAAGIGRDTAARAARRGTAAAEAEIAEKRAKREAEAAEATEAARARGLLSGRKADIESRLAAEQSKKDAANYAVFQAQGRYDAARLGGSRAGQSAALSGLHAAQETAQNVNLAADRAMNALQATLDKIEAKMKQLDAVLAKRAKQQGFAQSESPAGE